MSECILWEGHCNPKGYPQITRDKKTYTVSRIVFSQSFGEIPKGMHVLHRCDVRNCINPDHLFLGTNRDNVDDRVKKGRGARLFGEKHGRHKLTEMAVRLIRASSLPYHQLAECFNVCKATIAHAKQGRNWSYLNSL